MGKTKLDIQVNQWIEISISDLLSSRILYLAGQYRNSYFFFQQAVEKANKALALYIGFTEVELKKIGHDQMKIYKKIISNKVTEIKHLIENLDRFPKAKAHPLLQPFNFREYYESLLSSLRTIQNLYNEDLVYIPTDVINNLLYELDEIEYAELEIPKYNDPAFKENLLSVSELIGMLEVEPGGTTKIEFDTLINQEHSLLSLHKLLKYQMKMSIIFSFIEYTFIISAFLTIQHSALTRYIEGERNPLKIYTKKLPLVKKQSELMDVFERALLEFKRFLNSKPIQF